MSGAATSLGDMLRQDQNMIDVVVDTNKFVQVLHQINSHMKSQEQRISALESQLHNFVSLSKYEEEIGNVQTLSHRCLQKIEENKSVVKDLSTQMKDLQESTDGRINELIVSHTISLKNCQTELNSAIEQVAHLATKLDKTVANHTNMIAVQDHKVQTQEHQIVKVTNMEVRLTKDMDDLSKRVQFVHSEFLKHCSTPHSVVNNVTQTVVSERSKGPDQSELDKLKEDIVKLSQPKEKAPELTESKVHEIAESVLSGMISDLKDTLKHEVEEDLGADISSRIDKLKELLTPPKVTEEEKRDVSNGISQSQLLELLTTTRTNRAHILQHAEDIRNFQRKITELSEMRMRVTQLNKPTYSNGLVDHQFDAKKLREELTEMLKGLELIVTDTRKKFDQLLDYIKKKEQTAEHTDSDFRKIIYGIIDELRLIHSYADGMQTLPVQNFETVAPDYFAKDPSWESLTRQYSSMFPPKEAADAADAAKESVVRVISTQNKEASNNDANFMEEGYVAPPPTYYNVNKISGLLHLVSGPKGGGGLRPEHATMAKNQSKAKIGAEAASVAVPLGTVVRAPVHLTATDNIVVVDISHHESKEQGELPSDEVLRELRFMLGSFKQEKGQLMTTVDRKVDREMVERIFDKFRATIKGVGDRVQELTDKMNDFATRKDMDALSTAISNIPTQKAVTTRAGAECLYCGRGGPSMTTESARTDEMARYLYADGAVFRRSVSSVAKISLPPLKEPSTQQ